MAYSDTTVDGVRTFEIFVVGDSAIYNFGVHPTWENFVNTSTTGSPRKVARRALESADKEVTTWIQQMCGNTFLSNDIGGMLHVDLDESGWSTTWTARDYTTYWHRFTLLKGDTRKCFDRIRATRTVDYASAQFNSGVVSVALHMAGSLYAITDSTVVTRDMLLSSTGVDVVAEGSSLKVVEFTVSTVVNDSVFEAVAHGSDFTDEQRAILGVATPNSKIFLENIKVISSLGGLRAVGAQVLFVK